MNKIRLFLIAMMMCVTISGKAQTKNTTTQKEYYMYSWIQVRWANKANGEACFVLLVSRGLGKKQKPCIMKTDDGRSIVFDNMMDGLNYLELNGWELVFTEHNSFSNLLVRRKTTKEELEMAVKEYTHYETETPKIQLSMAEKNINMDYE